MDSCAESNDILIQKGSPEIGGPEFVCIGKIHRTHGIRGDVVFNPMTDFPERIHRGRTVFIGEEHSPMKIARVRTKPPFLLIGFNELTDETEASEYRNTFVYVKASDLPALPEGEYYFHQLIGLNAIDESSNEIGKVKDILETGANDVYVIAKPDGKEELIPDIPEFILGIDLITKTIRVHIPEWD